MVLLITILQLLFLFPTQLPSTEKKSPPAETNRSFQADSLYFTDISFTSGVADPNDPNPAGGHSAQFVDIDEDGRPDLFITMLLDDVPLSDLFYRNIDDSSFVEEAASRGINDFDGGSHGAAFADLDNDGDYDLVNGTTYGTGGFISVNNVFKNEGNGFFTDVTESSGILFRDWPTRGVVTFDMDGDGDLDIFCVTNFKGTDDPPGELNEIYRNDGNFTFTPINFGALYTAPVGQGGTDTDFDNDGDIDLIAGNRTGDLNIFLNDGLGNFTLIPPATIGVLHRGREGATMGDVDNDGDLDMLLSDADFTDGSSIEHLYLNDGDGTFTYAVTFTNTVGYMGGFADLDNDTDLDLIFSGGLTSYINDGFGNYSAGPAVPFEGADSPRAVAFSDIDNDGDVDFAVGAKRSKNFLIRNNFDSGNWLKVKLVSPFGQAGAFSAKIKIYPPGQTSGQQIGFREARSSNGYLAQNDPVLHFGLGEHELVDVVVTFLDESSITQTNVNANQTITIDASISGPQTPIVNQFTPNRGQVGDMVLITGVNFTNTSKIKFNGTIAPNFTVLSDSQMEAELPSDATSGFARIRNDIGIGTSNVPLIVVYAPEITSIPDSATIGMEVALIGNNFDEIDDIFFNGTRAESYTFVFPNQVDVIVPPGATTGPITISNLAGSDTSIALLQIVSERLDLTIPNGSEIWLVGMTNNIMWDSFGAFNSVNLEYSFDNGNIWLTIVTNTDDDGIYEWVVPNVESDNCLIRVVKTGDAGLADVSDSVFSIEASSLTLTSPNGGEAWPVGPIQTITWDWTGGIEIVKLRYSTDNGVNWVTFETTGNTGSFDWLVPDAVSDSCLIRILDKEDGIPFDESDSVFRVFQAPYLMTSPNGGEQWLTDSIEEIAWTTDSSTTTVKLEYSSDSGLTWNSIADSTTNDGSYMWLIPSNIVSDFCLIRVSDPVDGEPFDVSDSIFSVFQAPYLVASPNGGEQWLANSIEEISWTTDSSTTTVKLEYSSDSGLTWNSIVDSTTNDGSYMWFIPGGTVSDLCLIRVSDPVDGEPSDVSDSVFSVFQAPYLVASPNGGEQWLTDSIEEIAWTTDSSTSTVKLEYSSDSGVTWNSIVDSTTNDGSYMWLIPGGTVSDLCLIRVSDPVDGEPSDVSDNVFSITFSVSVNDASSSIPTKFNLYENYPNPFNLETTLRYDLPKVSDVKITIYDILGNKVRSLIDEQQQSGQYAVSWDGRNDANVIVTSGVYFYRLVANQYSQLKKMILLK